MGKSLLQQRAGRGNINFRNPGWLKVGKARYPNIKGHYIGKVIDILHNPGIAAPLAEIKLENGVKFFTQAVQGLRVGQKIEVGGTNPSMGNIVEVSSLPEGTLVCNIEKNRGDGGRYARVAGGYGIIIGKSGNKVMIKLPSDK